MCTCPPHVVEIASQTASSLGPLAGIALAALTGSKLGQWLLQFVRRNAAKFKPNHEATAK